MPPIAALTLLFRLGVADAEGRELGKRYTEYCEMLNWEAKHASRSFPGAHHVTVHVQMIPQGPWYAAGEYTID